MEYHLSENIFPRDNKRKTKSERNEEPVISDLRSQDSDFTNEENHCSDEAKFPLQVGRIMVEDQVRLMCIVSSVLCWPRGLGDMSPRALCLIGFFAPLS